jgi:protein gp37
MGAKTGIEWTDATWNVIRGCRRVSEGCRFCYAEKVAHRFCGKGMPYEGLTVEGKARWNGEVSFHREHLLDPIQWTKPKRIFVNSMSDVFYEGFTDAQIAAQFAVMMIADWHQYQVLTKRPERLVAWLKWMDKQADKGGTLIKALEAHMPHDAAISDRTMRRLSGGLKNLRLGIARLGLLKHEQEAGAERWGAMQWPAPHIMLGTSVEHQEAARQRLPHMMKVASGWPIFLSCEPLIGPLTLEPWLTPSHRAINWIIVGGESGDKASRPCQASWVRALREECKVAQIPFFFKQWGDWKPDDTDELGATSIYTGDKKANGALLDGELHHVFFEPASPV